MRLTVLCLHEEAGGKIGFEGENGGGDRESFG